MQSLLVSNICLLRVLLRGQLTQNQCSPKTHSTTISSYKNWNTKYKSKTSAQSIELWNGEFWKGVEMQVNQSETAPRVLHAVAAGEQKFVSNAANTSGNYIRRATGKQERLHDHNTEWKTHMWASRSPTRTCGSVNEPDGSKSSTSKLQTSNTILPHWIFQHNYCNWATMKSDINQTTCWV